MKTETAEPGQTCPDIIAEQTFDLDSPYLETSLRAFASRVRSDMQTWNVQSVLHLTHTSGSSFNVVIFPCETDSAERRVDNVLSDVIERVQRSAHQRIVTSSALAHVDAEPSYSEADARERLRRAGIIT